MSRCSKELSSEVLLCEIGDREKEQAMYIKYIAWFRVRSIDGQPHLQQTSVSGTAERRGKPMKSPHRVQCPV